MTPPTDHEPQHAHDPLDEVLGRLVDELPRLRESVDKELPKLRQSVDQLRGKLRGTRVTNTLLAVALLLSIGVELHRYATDTCVRNWAETTADRTQLLTPLNNARNKAYDDFLAVIAAHEHGTAYDDALARANRASSVYEAAVSANPLPPPPSYNCSTF